MPDSRKHRGAHPEDAALFAPERLPALRAATGELSWLLSRDYPPSASLKLVGDRHRLNDRQRIAVSRAACSDAGLSRRASTCVPTSDLRGRRLAVDGFNLLITVEAALGGGVLLRCRDGCTRDMASIHGSYRSVEETDAALRLIGDALAEVQPEAVRWLLDRPVSNSGRLAARLEETARAHDWPWSVETVFNPDRELIASPDVVVSSDSNVLDSAAAWTDLASLIVGTRIPSAWCVDLRDGVGAPADDRRSNSPA